MPDETKDAPVADVVETPAPPVPEVSPSSPPESSAGQGLDAEALVGQVAEQVSAKLTAELDNLVDARFKSAKDKRFSKVDEIAEWVKKAGGDMKAIQGDLTINELRSRLEAIESGRDAGPSSPPPQDIQAETAKLLDDLKGELGVDFTREELEQLAGSKAYSNNAQWYATLSSAAVKKAKSGGVTPAAVVGSSGTAPPVGDDQEALLNEMNSLYAGDKGSLSLPKNKQRLKELSEKLNELSPPKPAI